jgi:hypothetical protein
MVLKIIEQIYNNVACFFKRVFGEMSPIKTKEATDRSNILGTDLEEIIPNIYDKNKFAIEKYCEEDYKIIQVSANEVYLQKYRFLTIFDRSGCERYIDDILGISHEHSVVGFVVRRVLSEEGETTFVSRRSPEMYYTKSRRESIKKEFMIYMGELTTYPMKIIASDVIDFILPTANFPAGLTKLYHEPLFVEFIYVSKAHNEPKDLQKQTFENKNSDVVELYVAPKKKESLHKHNSLFIESLVSVVGLTVVVISSVATYMLLNPLTL